MEAGLLASFVWTNESSFPALFFSVLKSYLMLHVTQIQIFNIVANVPLDCCLQSIMQNNTCKILLRLQTFHVWWTQVLPVQLLENESLKRFCAFPLTHSYTKPWISTGLFWLHWQQEIQVLYCYGAMTSLLLSQALYAKSRVAGFIAGSLLNTGLRGVFELDVI